TRSSTTATCSTRKASPSPRRYVSRSWKATPSPLAMSWTSPRPRWSSPARSRSTRARLRPHRSKTKAPVQQWIGVFSCAFNPKVFQEQRTMSNDMKDQMTEVKGQIDESKAAEQLGQPRLVPLARNYLAQSIDAVCRIPSPNLKNAEFRATLLHWRAVMLQSIAATKNHASAFTVAIQAIASSEGALQAKRLIDN